MAKLLVLACFSSLALAHKPAERQSIGITKDVTGVLLPQKPVEPKEHKKPGLMRRDTSTNDVEGSLLQNKAVDAKQVVTIAVAANGSATSADTAAAPVAASKAPEKQLLEVNAHAEVSQAPLDAAQLVEKAAAGEEEAEEFEAESNDSEEEGKNDVAGRRRRFWTARRRSDRRRRATAAPTPAPTPRPTPAPTPTPTPSPTPAPTPAPTTTTVTTTTLTTTTTTTTTETTFDLSALSKSLAARQAPVSSQTLVSTVFLACSAALAAM